MILLIFFLTIIFMSLKQGRRVLIVAASFRLSEEVKVTLAIVAKEVEAGTCTLVSVVEAAKVCIFFAIIGEAHIVVIAREAVMAGLQLKENVERVKTKLRLVRFQLT